MPRGIRIRFKLPGPKARKVNFAIRKYCVPTTSPYPLVIRGGKGCFIQDVDGNWFLDFNSNVCSTPLGYNHQAIIGVLKKYSRVSPHKIAGQDFYAEEHAELVKALVRITPPNLRKVFISNSGAEAVENAIKFAYRKLGPLTGVSCYGAFHGRTLGALTFTCSKPVQKRNYPQLKVKRIKFCTQEHDPGIEQVNRAARKGKTAFIIVEAVQGEGGYRIASKKFLKNLEQAARSAGVPLILDEIQTGLGRTGRWWAFQHYGIRPDIITSAKALQVGATISSEKWAVQEAGAVSSTWGGGARIDLAVGLATINAIQKEKLILNARKMGKYFLRRLKELQEVCSCISDVAGLGLMLRMELKSARHKDILLQEAFRSGLLLLPCGEKTIRLAPPLIIGKREIDLGLNILEKNLKKL